MPLSHPQTQAAPGSSTNSRKRTHAEITRSESRSQSPQHPSKRRRTISSPLQRISSSPDSAVASSDGARFVGDGFDYRQPRMSAASASQPQAQDTIDLTLEDDSPPPRSFSVVFNHPDPGPLDDNESPIPDFQQIQGAPPFALQQSIQSQQIIDLSSDEEDVEDGGQDQAGGGTRIVPDSPEIQFMGERVLPQPPPIQPQPHRRTHLPPPPTFGALGNMATLLRGMTQNFLRGGRAFPEEAFDRIDGLVFNHPAIGRGGFEAHPDDVLDEYDELQMDYGRTAFDINGDLLVVEDPDPHGPLNRVNESAYKEPRPAKEGFTRNYEEDDMLICGLCGDELATGTTEQKQQVWIVKQCGHAYCGDCAHHRNIAKSKNNKDARKQANKKTTTFRVCQIPGCNKAVDSKTKMFQIYL